jgi:4'-phosphopantetheinyl transferase
VIDLWFFRAPPGGEPAAPWLALLSPAERARCGRLATPLLRRRFAAAHAGLRAILARHMKCPPAAIPFALGPHGKPRVAALAPLDFNLSHAGDGVLVAIADGPCGADLEELDTVGDLEGLARLILSEPERNALPPGPSARRTEAICAAWTVREACAKALGLGLALDFRRIRPLSPPGRDGCGDYRIEGYGHYRTRDLRPAPGFVASVAIPAGERPRLRSWRAALAEDGTLAAIMETETDPPTLIPTTATVPAIHPPMPCKD